MHDPELALVGAAVLDPSVIADAAAVVSPADFANEGWRTAWEAILWLDERREPVDVVRVGDRLRDVGTVSPTLIGTIAEASYTAANALGYAQDIRDQSLMRQLRALGQEAQRMRGDPNEIAATLEQRIAELRQTGQTSTLIDARQYVNAAVERFQAAQESGREITGLATGFRDLDRTTTGLHPGDLVVVAGRPSMGKTSFALNIVEQVCTAGGSVAFFSLEMGGEDLMDRVASSLSGVPFSHIRSPANISDEDMRSYLHASGKGSQYRLSIDACSSLTANEARARSRQHKRRHGLDLVVVDYLQLMDGQGDNRTNEISSISRGLKGMARDLGVPVIALSQLNRSVDHRADKRPRMSDLREGGSIEQDADVILFLYRDEVYDDESPHQGVAECQIGKQRNGPLARLDLTFVGEQMRFRDYSGPPFDVREGRRRRKRGGHQQFNDEDLG